MSSPNDVPIIEKRQKMLIKLFMCKLSEVAKQQEIVKLVRLSLTTNHI